MIRLKRKIFFSFSIAILALVLAFALMACADEDAETYAITAAPADNCTITLSATEAASGTTVSFVVVPANGYTVTGVYANDLPCTAGSDGSYSFTMPENVVTITVTVSPVSSSDENKPLQEVISDEDLSWAKDTPSVVPAAKEEDSSAFYMIYFEFAESKYLSGPNNVELKSLTPEVIPDSALESLSLSSVNSGNLYKGGNFMIDLKQCSVGEAFVSLHVKGSMGGTRIDNTVVKKIEIVPYEDFEPELWNETVVIEIPDYADYENLTIQVYNDNMWKYGVPSDLQQIPVVSEITTVHSLYSPYGKLSVLIYYTEGEETKFFELNSIVGEGSTVTGEFVTFDGSYAYFPLPDRTLTINAG